MRCIYLLSFLLISVLSYSQDKIYMRDNSVVEGKIREVREKSLMIQVQNDSRWIFKKEIAIIIYENGVSEVIPANADKKSVKLNDWMIGTNVFQPISGIGGIYIERNVANCYSLRFGQAFHFFNGYQIKSYSSLMNNFYLGRGSAKLLLNAGLNVIYTEHPGSYDYPSPYPLLSIEDYANPYYCFPYPVPGGVTTSLSAELTFGTGMYVDLASHFAFGAQVNFSSSFTQGFENIALDLVNSGFSFYYKF